MAVQHPCWCHVNYVHNNSLACTGEHLVSPFAIEPSPQKNLKCEMSTPYYPSSTKECFEYSAIAHHHGILSSEEYLDRMLAHLSGVRHSEDNSVMNLQDPLSMVFHTCTEQLAEVIIEGETDISIEIIFARSKVEKKI